MTPSFKSDWPHYPALAVRPRRRGDRMRRRDFSLLLSGATLAWSLKSRAQPTAIPVIGLLNPGSPTSDAARASGYRGSASVAVFVEWLRELVWSDGRNILIDYRWGEGREQHYSDIAIEFVRLKVSVIVAGGNRGRRCGEASDLDHSNRICWRRRRPGSREPSRKFCPTRGKHHGCFLSACGYCAQTI